MKRLADMTKGERHEFVDMAARIAMAMMATPRIRNRSEHVIMMALIIKTFDRPMLNCQLEFEMDPRAFAIDAGKMFVTFVENTADMGKGRASLSAAQLRHMEEILRITAQPDFLLRLETRARSCITTAREAGL